MKKVEVLFKDCMHKIEENTMRMWGYTVNK